MSVMGIAIGTCWTTLDLPTRENQRNRESFGAVRVIALPQLVGAILPLAWTQFLPLERAGADGDFFKKHKGFTVVVWLRYAEGVTVCGELGTWASSRKLGRQ